MPPGKLNQFFELSGSPAKDHKPKKPLCLKVGEGDANTLHDIGTNVDAAQLREQVQSKRTGSIPVEDFRGSRQIMNGRLGAALDPDLKVVRDEHGHQNGRCLTNYTSIPSNRRSVAASRSHFPTVR